MTGVQTCALPIWNRNGERERARERERERERERDWKREKPPAMGGEAVPWGLGGSSRWARLTAHLPADAPQLTELPQDVTVELGRSALLACRATGHPPPMVTWRRGDGQPLGPGQGSRSGRPDSGVLFFESKRLGLRAGGQGRQNGFRQDRKSTRLNSSH